MIVRLLNFLHRRQRFALLCFFCHWAYRLKGWGRVVVHYHPEFRGYEFRVQGVSYLSLGPGWAYHEAYLTHLLKETYGYAYMPSAGDCVVDIGSGLGEEVVAYAGLVGEQGLVLALEANPKTFLGLQYLCRVNGFANVKPFNLAIFKEDGEVSIEDDEENYLTNTIAAENSKVAGFLVKAITLDTLVAREHIQRIDFLKANIEGAEQFMIQGMKQSVQIVKHVCISCHDFRHRYHQHGEFYMTRDQVIVFLQENGFDVSWRNTGNHVVDDYIYGRKSSVR